VQYTPLDFNKRKLYLSCFLFIFHVQHPTLKTSMAWINIMTIMHSIKPWHSISTTKMIRNSGNLFVKIIWYVTTLIVTTLNNYWSKMRRNGMVILWIYSMLVVLLPNILFFFVKYTKFHLTTLVFVMLGDIIFLARVLS